MEAARRRSLKHCERVIDDEANLIQIRLEIGCAGSRLAHAEGHVLQCSCLNNLIGFDVALPTLLIGQRIAVLVATHGQVASCRQISLLSCFRRRKNTLGARSGPERWHEPTDAP